MPHRTRRIYIPGAGESDAVNFDCPYCRQNLDADADLAGQSLRCPTCGNVIRVPTPRPELAAGNGLKKCPFCSEPIKVAAIKCRHCGSMLDGNRLSQRPPPPEPMYRPPPHEKKSAVLQITRTKETAGAFRKLRVLVDDCEVAALKCGQSTQLHVSEGVHSVSVKMDWQRSPMLQVYCGSGSLCAVMVGSFYVQEVGTSSASAQAGCASITPSMRPAVGTDFDYPVSPGWVVAAVIFFGVCFWAIFLKDTDSSRSSPMTSAESPSSEYNNHYQWGYEDAHFYKNNALGPTSESEALGLCYRLKQTDEGYVSYVDYARGFHAGWR